MRAVHHRPAPPTPCEAPDAHPSNHEQVTRSGTRTGVAGVAVEAAWLVLAVVAYLAVRGITRSDPGAAMDHARALLRVEGALGIDHERGIQAVALDHHALVRVFDAVYVWCFWPFVVGALVVLYRIDRSRYRRMRTRAVRVGRGRPRGVHAVPGGPPRYLPGFVDTVAVISGQGDAAHPGSFANQYAAVPSFHVGWTVLAGVCLASALRNPWLRRLALAHGPLMAVTVVVTGNHFVVDGILGVAASLGGLAVAGALDRRQAVATMPAPVTPLVPAGLVPDLRGADAEPARELARAC